MTAPAVTRYRVLAPCLTARTMAMSNMFRSDRGGWTAITLYQGGLLPLDAPAEEIERYLAEGLIEEVNCG